MRPIRLEVEGFACFSDPAVIDFEDLDLFAITGPTGSGKTSIIDAICYALYGKTPRGADRKTLVSHDKDNMRVDFEFSARGKRYRVTRQINQTRSVKRDGTERRSANPSPVQLAEYDAGRGGWRGLDDRSDDIGRRVMEVVGLDFEAFTRCVVLPQGRFAEFLNGAPAERRKILEDLLDIGIYGRLMQKANQISAEAGGHAASSRQQLQETYADATPERLAEYEAERDRVEASIAALAKDRDAYQEAVGLAAEVGTHLVRKKTARDRADGAEAKLAGVAEILKRAAPEIEELRRAELAIAEEIVALAYDPEAHSQIGRLLAQAAEVARRTSEVKQLQASVPSEADVKKAAEALKRAVDAVTKAETTLVKAREQRDHARTMFAALDLRRSVKPGDPCPVCGGKVGKLAHEDAPDLDAATRREREAADALKLAQAAQQVATRAESEVRARADGAVAALDRASAALEAARRAIAAGLPPGLEGTEKALRVEDERLRRLAETTRKLQVNHKAATAARDDLERRLSTAERDAAVLRAEIETARAEQAAADADVKRGREALTDMAEAHGWDHVLARLKEAIPATELKAGLTAAQEAVDRANREAVRLHGQVEQIKKDIVTAANLREAEARHQKRCDLYKELGFLLRSNEFPLFIMARALDSLAKTASLHLQDLHFERFALERDDSDFVVVDLWQGGQRRASSTLSGGETFIVSLALALALAESLPAIRENITTSLDSLFIDEGFGTLDPETLDTVMTALENLKTRERMVGIITHVPEIAKRIEHRIEVTGGPEGSHVRRGAA